MVTPYIIPTATETKAVNKPMKIAHFVPTTIPLQISRLASSVPRKPKTFPETTTSGSLMYESLPTIIAFTFIR